MRFAVFCLLAAALPAGAQESNALMNAQQAAEVYSRSLQLMDSSTVAIPELNRAGAPVIENARQAAKNLLEQSGNTELTYAFLTNVRAYLMLADAVPKPYPFPAEATRQLAELREALNRTEAHFRALLGYREVQVRGADRDNIARYREANQKLSPPVAGRPRVVFLGDSITDGWHLNEYFPDSDYLNRGISGQVTGEMLGRFKVDVIDLKPDAVLILAGTNDLARGVEVATIESHYSMLADLADKHGIKVIFASVLPVSDYHKGENPAWEQTRRRPPAMIRRLNEWIKSTCNQRGYAYVDYYSAMVDKTGQLTADLADDGLHPNSRGYRVMAPLALAAIGRTGGSSQQKPARRRLLSKD